MYTDTLPIPRYVPNLPIFPVLPPDDPNAPYTSREPSIDPPPTVPRQEAPAEDPARPKAPGRTTYHH